MGKRLNSPDQKSVLHYVTLNIRERQRPFQRAEYARLALDELRYECDRHPAYLVGYVVMPDHLHFLILPQDGKLTRFLSRYKPGVTLKLDALAQHMGRHKEREWLVDASGRRSLWQDGKYSLPVYSEPWIQQKLDYIHDNPVRAGLVERPRDYPWSSYVAYWPELGLQPPVPVDLNWAE